MIVHCQLIVESDAEYLDVPFQIDGRSSDVHRFDIGVGMISLKGAKQYGIGLVGIEGLAISEKPRLETSQVSLNSANFTRVV